MSPVGSATELQKIINDGLLYPVFQPIVDLHLSRIHGYESLIRGPANSTLHSPLILLDTANRHNLMSELEYACQETSCRHFSNQNGEGKLFINVSPMSLLNADYKQSVTHRIIETLNIPADSIVIELSEQYPMEDYDSIRQSLEYFRNSGFEIAIDDLGAGYSGLRSWSEIRPDYVKIDRHFIDHINEDPVKREFVRSIQEISTELGCKVVAEGIETAEELNTIRMMGIRFGQGYFLGRPELAPAPESLVINKLQETETPIRQVERSTLPISELSQSSPIVGPNLPMSEIFDMLSRSQQFNCLPVIEQGKPLGLIERQEILELFSSLYARELHSRKPVKDFIKTDTVIVDYNATLEEVSRSLTKQGDEYLSQHFIITKNDSYYGLGLTSTLFRKITEQQIRNARYANPLTLLPGNVPIHEHLEKKLEQKNDSYVAYFDLNNFKPFNDYYGYSMGDDALVLLSHLLQKIITDRNDFIGHIGGDDFVVIFESKNWASLCEEVMTQFSQRIESFYRQEDREAGGIWGTNRQGQKQFFDMLSLAIGVVHPDPFYCQSYHDVASLAMDAKMEAKRMGKNQLFYSRRRRPSNKRYGEVSLTSDSQ